jgi:flavin-binding protein dodecin
VERESPKTAAKKVVVKKAAVKKAVARATKASAKLENREVPAGYVRPAAVAHYIASRQTPKH